ncbi:MAG TPA: hypothetical protein VI114_02870, partial [Chthoniobacterales bacterium]
FERSTTQRTGHFYSARQVIDQLLCQSIDRFISGCGYVSWNWEKRNWAMNEISNVRELVYVIFLLPRLLTHQLQDESGGP